MSIISRLPSLTHEPSYSGTTTTNSPFASGLTTPNDEEPHHSLFSPVIEDQTPKQLGSFDTQHPFRKHARKGPLSKVVSKAREAARSVFETPKRLKKRRSVAAQEGVTTKAEPEESPGVSSDALSYVRKSTEAVHRMIVESPSARSPALVSVGSFDYLDSTHLPHLSRRPTLGCRRSPVPVSARAEHTVQPVPQTFQQLSRVFILVLCFPFWTFAVGGCIFLCPAAYLDTVTFNSGFVPPPLSGIARFGYWAENAIPHMCTFLAGLCFLVWWRPDLGLSILAVVLCLFWRAWSRFELDKDVPLGEDDRQTLYLVSTGHALGDGHRFRTSNGSFMELPSGIRLSGGML